MINLGPNDNVDFFHDPSMLSRWISIVVPYKRQWFKIFFFGTNVTWNPFDILEANVNVFSINILSIDIKLN